MSKRLLCLFLSVLMVIPLGIPAFGATFSDVPETNNYYEAIDLLSEFGIILGDAGAGTFRPDAEISREEFSVIVTRILGVSNIVPSMDNLPFTDVTPVVCDEWAIIATKLAYDLGIISGYGNGKFGPKDPVTYEQVVKMLVCAIGYGPAAVEYGGWPTGYMKVANDLGITDNAVMLQTANAPRGIVAQLVYNCLDVDLMEPVGNGQSEVKHGHTILTDKLGYTYAEGVVTGIPGLAYNMVGKVIHENEVEIDGTLICNAGTTSAADYFGYSGEFYYKKKGATNTLVSFKPTDENIVIELSPEKIDKVNEKQITYYTDEYETESETLSTKGAVYIYNGKAKDLDEVTKPNIGTMKIYDNNDDEIIDLIMVNDTRIMVANSVDSVKKIVVNKFDTSERLVLDGETKDVEFFKDGKASSFSSIVRDSVLMVTENDDKITVDVITKTVTGNVESEEENGEKVGIGGELYEFMPEYAKYLENNEKEQFKVGDDVTLYVTSDNKILYSKIKTVTMKFGYLINARADDDKEITQGRILNSLGKIEIVEFAEKTYINGERIKYYYDIPNKLIDAITDDEDPTKTLTNNDKDAVGAEMSQLIKYTETDGKISHIYTMQKSGDSTRELVQNVPYTDEEYKYSSTTKKIGDIILDSKTKVVKVPSARNDYENYKISTGVNGLANTAEYRFEAYDVSETGVAAYVVVYGNTITESWSVPVVLASIVTKTNKDGDIVNSITVLNSGKTSTRETEDIDVLAGYKVGDVIRYATKNNIITDAKKIVSPVSGSVKVLEAVTNVKYDLRDYYYSYGTTRTADDYKSTVVVSGTVYSRDDDRIVLVEDVVDEEGNLSEDAQRHTFDFNDTIVYYLYDASKDKPLITTDITKEFLSTYLDAGEDASKVVIYNTSHTTMKFIYVIEN